MSKLELNKKTVLEFRTSEHIAEEIRLELKKIRLAEKFKHEVNRAKNLKNKK